MRKFVSVICLVLIMAVAGCTEDDKVKVKNEKPVIAKKYSVANGTFNIPGDITIITIN